MGNNSSLRNSFPLIAGGNIAPSVFICQSSTAGNTALTSTTGAGLTKPIGITDQSSEAAPVDGAATYHATTGNPVSWFGAGATCLLTLGSGGCNPGDLLKPDASGFGVTATTDHDIYGARAIQGGASGEKVLVQVAFGEISA